MSLVYSGPNGGNIEKTRAFVEPMPSSITKNLFMVSNVMVGAEEVGELVSEPDADSCHGNRYHFVHPAIYDCGSSVEWALLLLDAGSERKRRWKRRRRIGWRNDLMVNAGEQSWSSDDNSGFRFSWCSVIVKEECFSSYHRCDVDMMSVLTEQHKHDLRDLNVALVTRTWAR